jgi:hypothetical protein
MLDVWGYFSRDGYTVREWRAALAAGKRVAPLWMARQALLEAVGGRGMGSLDARSIQRHVEITSCGPARKLWA